jgi:hypothetical protein
MHVQARANTQIFTIFGNYLVEQNEDYSPANNDPSNSQDRYDTGKIKWGDVLRKLRASLGGINP